MGYYGLGPGMNSRMADKLTVLEQLLRRLPLETAMETLELLEQLCRRIVRAPGDLELRRLDLSANINALLAEPSAQAVLQELGWQPEGQELRLPAEVRLDFQGHVVKCIEAKDFYKKEAERVKKLKRLAADPSKAAIQEQLALDRRERSSATPVQSNTDAPQHAEVAAVPHAEVVQSYAAAKPVEQVPAAKPETQLPASRESSEQLLPEENDEQAATNIKALEDIRALREQRYHAMKSQRGSRGVSGAPRQDSGHVGRMTRCFRRTA